MSKDKDKEAPKVEAKAEPMPATGCVICGSYTGSLEPVTANARAHATCAQSRPDVIAKVKARA